MKRKPCSLLREHNVLEPGETLESIRHVEQRVRALHLLQEIVDLQEDQSKPFQFTAQAASKMNNLFTQLDTYFIPTVPPTEEEMVADCRKVLRRERLTEETIEEALASEEWMTCFNSTFAILVIRMGLKHYRLPLVMAKGWMKFAANFTGIVMSS